MTTNFFQAIAALGVEADWKMVISNEQNGMLTVSVLLVNNKTGDDAKKIIPPMNFKGTAHELDEGFFAAITEPARQTDKLFTNMEAYLKQVEQARLQSKMEQEQQNKDKKEKDERRKKYEDKMKRVAELEGQKKYGEAIGAMPQTDLFPEQAEEIKKKTEELKTKHGQLSLL